MVTLVPDTATVFVVRCTQKVSPSVPRNWLTRVWFAPSVLATWPSQSLPVPRTSELVRVVTSDADGAPDGELAPPMAPIAPEPLVPVVSTPLKLITVMFAAANCDSVAVTVALVRAFAANARQISAVPRCVLVRLTSVHVRLPPVIPVTVVAPGSTLEASTKASSSSLPAVVENVPDAIVCTRVDLPAVLVASIVIVPVAADVAVNDTPLTLTLFVTVTDWLAGEKLTPLLVGVIV